MSDGALDETWDAWAARIAADLEALSDDDWLTFTVHVQSQASSTYAAGRAPHGRRRGGARPARQARVPDVFVQARRIEGVLALECIGDTEFEGLTDLTDEAQDALIGLGWVRDRHEPEFSSTFADADGHGDDAARAAADLLKVTLSRVLAAETPADVDVRRSPRP